MDSGDRLRWHTSWVPWVTFGPGRGLQQLFRLMPTRANEAEPQFLRVEPRVAEARWQPRRGRGTHYVKNDF